jgi:hypothetical protein
VQIKTNGSGGCVYLSNATSLYMNQGYYFIKYQAIEFKYTLYQNIKIGVKNDFIFKFIYDGETQSKV